MWNQKKMREREREKKNRDRKKNCIWRSVNQINTQQLKIQQND